MLVVNTNKLVFEIFMCRFFFLCFVYVHCAGSLFIFRFRFSLFMFIFIFMFSFSLFILFMFMFIFMFMFRFSFLYLQICLGFFSYLQICSGLCLSSPFLCMFRFSLFMFMLMFRFSLFVFMFMFRFSFAIVGINLTHMAYKLLMDYSLRLVSLFCVAKLAKL